MRKHHLRGTYDLRAVERLILFSNHLTKTASQATLNYFIFFMDHFYYHSNIIWLIVRSINCHHLSLP